MRYTVVHEGTPMGYVELSLGELVAGQLVPSPTFEVVRPTVQAGSAALLALGFFGAATAESQNGAGTALRAAAALQFDLVDIRGSLAPATFVNLIEAPEGGVVVLACFRHSHASVPALLPSTPSDDQEAARPSY